MAWIPESFFIVPIVSNYTTIISLKQGYLGADCATKANIKKKLSQNAAWLGGLLTDKWLSYILRPYLIHLFLAYFGQEWDCRKAVKFPDYGSFKQNIPAITG
jgi:hypothetical protein